MATKNYLSICVQTFQIDGRCPKPGEGTQTVSEGRHLRKGVDFEWGYREWTPSGASHGC